MSLEFDAINYRVYNIFRIEHLTTAAAAFLSEKDIDGDDAEN